jgi:hypothetical protein
MVSRNYRKAHPEVGRELNRLGGLRRKAKLADYDRIVATALPADWSSKPEGWVFIGLILLQRDYISNEELAVCLDASGGPKCPYSEDGTWGVITQPGRAANYITAIRKWVNRPGKTAGHERVHSHR